MARSLLEIKARLASVRSIGKMTKAMKLIASSRYARWKVLWDGNKPYATAMEEAMKLCLKRVDFGDALPRCMSVDEGGRRLFLFIASSLGLCGSYNHELFKLFASTVSEEDDVVFIGEKGYRRFKDKVHKAYGEHVSLASTLTYDTANAFRHWLDRIYLQNGYSSANVLYARYENSLCSKPTVAKIYPLRLEESGEEGIPPTFDPSAAEVADLIVPHYLDSVLYRILLESNVSEESARRNSMDSATSAAEKLVEKLKISYDKLRQQKITQEIAEVVGGAQGNA